MLLRNWKPNGGSCTDDYAIRLARIRALLKGDSHFKLIHCRNIVPLVSIRRIYTGTETVHHPLSYFHHALLPFESYVLNQQRTNHFPVIFYCFSWCMIWWPQASTEMELWLVIRLFSSRVWCRYWWQQWRYILQNLHRK